MLLMGLAAAHFSPAENHLGDERAWKVALYPARLYDAVRAEAQSGADPRPIWDALTREIADLIHWASGTTSNQGGHRLLYQTQDGQWHWNQDAVTQYDVMHAWALEGGMITADDSEEAGTDGGSVTENTNAGDGGDEGLQVIVDMKQALFEAAELCDTGQEEQLRQALVMVEGPRKRIRDNIWNWRH